MMSSAISALKYTCYVRDTLGLQLPESGSLQRAMLQEITSLNASLLIKLDPSRSADAGKVTQADRGLSLKKAYNKALANPSSENLKALGPHVQWHYQKGLRTTKAARLSQSHNTDPACQRKRRGLRPREVKRVFNKRPKPTNKQNLSVATQFGAAVLRRPAAFRRPAAANPPDLD